MAVRMIIFSFMDNLLGCMVDPTVKTVNQKIRVKNQKNQQVFHKENMGHPFSELRYLWVSYSNFFACFENRVLARA